MSLSIIIKNDISPMSHLLHPNLLLSNIAIYFNVCASVCCCIAGCCNCYTTGNNNRSVLYALSLLLLTDVIVWYIKSYITQRHISCKPLCCWGTSSFCALCVNVYLMYKLQIYTYNVKKNLTL